MNKKNKVKVKKTEVKNKQKRTKKPTDQEVLLRLKRWIPNMVYNTTQRYANNALASIFNQEDMVALAEDTALEVLRRVKIGLKNPKHRESVDLKGCESYFKTAFKNQCLKLYEKYAKTDIRAGVTTTGSEEAMAVAISKNIYSPEDSYLLRDQLDLLNKDLIKVDAEYNKYLLEFSQKTGNKVSPSDTQHFHSIFNLLLEGYTAEEVEKKLGITGSDFLRQKRLMFEYVKKNHESILKDMQEHFEVSEDYRIHTKDVNKRQKLKQAVRDFKPKSVFYVHTSFDKEKNEFRAVLYANIDLYDRFDNKSNKVQSKLLKIKEVVGNSSDSAIVKKIKDDLWNESKTKDIREKVEKEAYIYLEEIKRKVA